VRQLVELHQGSVSATSEGEGRGSEFTVRLPSIGEPGSEDSVPKPRPQQSCHVVIVEDNDDSREMLRDLLRLRGHHVDVAADGPLGLEAITRHRPQVALVDLGLPGFDGYELARRIRAELGGNDVFLVALSGYGLQHDKERSREVGFDLHLVKPVTSEVLDQVLARVARGAPPD
jgi:CheY-like chemotaxis protein